MKEAPELGIIGHLFNDNESDKWKYEVPYTRLFSSISPKVILEIGVDNGGSIKVLRDLFPNAKVYGIDIDEKCAGEGIFIGDQSDHEFLGRVIEEIGSPDLVIDDGSHKSRDIWNSFLFLFPELAERGFYVIEDLEASYWDADRAEENDINIMDILKSLLDDLNWHGNVWIEWHPAFLDTHGECSNNEELIQERDNRVSYCGQNIRSISFYNLMAIVEKR